VTARRHEIISLVLVGVGLLLLARGPGLVLAGLGAALFMGGTFWRPLAGLQGVVAALPFYLFGRDLGGQGISPVEAALLLMTVAIMANVILARLGHGTSPLTPRVTLNPHPPSPPSPAERERGPWGGGDAEGPHGRHPGGGGLTPEMGGWGRYDLPIALLLVAALLSLLATEYLRLSLRELRTLIVEPVLFWYLCRAVVRTESQGARLVGALLAATAVVAVVGLAQLALGGAVTDVQGVRRVQGTYTSPNHFALLLGRVLPFLVAGVWLLPRWRPILLAGVLVCGGALVATFSLGGWLATGAALLVVVGMLGGRRPVIVLAVVGGLVAAVVLFAAPVERLAGRFDPRQGTGLVRLQLWAAAVELVGQSPLVGIGLDNFLYRYPALVPPGAPFEPNLSHPHNLLLQFWLELGLAGLIALIWLLWVFVRLAWAGARDARGSLLGRALAVGALGSMTDFVVHGMVDNSYFLPDLAIVFWLTLAVVCLPRPQAHDEKPGGRGSATPLLGGGMSRSE
jgi:O-antigen ligase